MNTYLGAAQDLHPTDIDADAVAAAPITYLEGYLWDPPHAKEAFLKAAEIAHDAGREVALTLVGCVLRRSLSRRVPRSDPRRHGRSRVRQRARAAQPLPDRRFRHARSTALRSDAKLAVVTRSEKGCVVVDPRRDRRGAGEPDRRAWSTPPAPATCSRPGSWSASRAAADNRTAARLGALAAAEVIQHLGARPETSLKALAQDNGFDL